MGQNSALMMSKQSISPTPAGTKKKPILEIRKSLKPLTHSTHIGNQEIAQAFDPFQFNPFQFQEQGEKQHPGNASRQGESGQIDKKLA